MSHEFETGLFVSTPAWHGLGTVLEDAPNVDDALQLAGLDWEVRPTAIQLDDGKAIATHKAMVRSSDGAVLGVVGCDFTPLQNRDAFEWVRPLVEAGDVSIEAAGALRGGRRVWVLAAVRDAQFDVSRRDSVKSYVLLAHGHDGSLAVRAGFTQVRVVCQNTLSMALGSDANLVTLKHTRNVKVSLEKARERLDMQRQKLKDDGERYQFLASRKCDEVNLARYVREVFKPGSADDPKQYVYQQDEVMRLFESGRGAELSRGTMWGALNAVTEHLTHHRGRGAESRQNAQWFGDGAKRTQHALDLAMRFAEDAPLAHLARQNPQMLQRAVLVN